MLTVKVDVPHKSARVQHTSVQVPHTQAEVPHKAAQDVQAHTDLHEAFDPAELYKSVRRNSARPLWNMPSYSALVHVLRKSVQERRMLLAQVDVPHKSERVQHTSLVQVPHKSVQTQRKSSVHVLRKSVQVRHKFLVLVFHTALMHDVALVLHTA